MMIGEDTLLDCGFEILATPGKTAFLPMREQHRDVRTITAECNQTEALAAVIRPLAESSYIRVKWKRVSELLRDGIQNGEIVASELSEAVRRKLEQSE